MLKLPQLLSFFLTIVVSVSATSQPLIRQKSPPPEMGGILILGKSLQRMTNICRNVFPSQAAVYEGIYQASSIPRYLALFKFEAKIPLVTGSRDEQLRALGMSEEEANSMCSTELMQHIDGFDRKYAHRHEEIEASFSELKKSISKAKQEAPKPTKASTNDPRFDSLVSK